MPRLCLPAVMAGIAVVAFLYSVSNNLEPYTIARQSIRELMSIAPREALVRRNCKEILLPLDEIRVGDIMIVRPGEKSAMDLPRHDPARGILPVCLGGINPGCSASNRTRNAQLFADCRYLARIGASRNIC